MIHRVKYDRNTPFEHLFRCAAGRITDLLVSSKSEFHTALDIHTLSEIPMTTVYKVIRRFIQCGILEKKKTHYIFNRDKPVVRALISFHDAVLERLDE